MVVRVRRLRHRLLAALRAASGCALTAIATPDPLWILAIILFLPIIPFSPGAPPAARQEKENGDTPRPVRGKSPPYPLACQHRLNGGLPFVPCLVGRGLALDHGNKRVIAQRYLNVGVFWHLYGRHCIRYVLREGVEFGMQIGRA